MKLQLIDNLAAVPKMLTTWVSVLAIVLGSLPDGMLQNVLGAFVPATRLPAVLGVIYILVRVIRQASVSGGRMALPAGPTQGDPAKPE